MFLVQNETAEWRYGHAKFTNSIVSSYIVMSPSELLDDFPMLATQHEPLTFRYRPGLQAGYRAWHEDQNVKCSA